ncbi:VOC family protein [Corynebacterium anserum]|uniref:VOC family protein n=1 Tax=Corynebacterium anserum TaxID=2684406 RepID=A0A7G7YLJ4_9CORY|nr:VOC family protein [Corynebacterium anserum]MBC2682594.1 VOC family protein [Corynebacterium anserum]QNH95364.1 VOC family protein [Corynebacterium anserum]
MPALVAEPGMPIWLDLATTDIEKAKAFYGPLLGWEFEDSAVDDGSDETAAMDEGIPAAASEDGESAATASRPSYTVAKRSGMPVAGIAQIPPENTSIWSLMVYTPELANAHEKAVKAGATSVLEPRHLDDQRGDMSVLVDPSGATVGLKKPAGEQAFFAAGEPGTPVWHELLIGKNWDETVKFYHELCGWDIKQVSATEDFHYAVGEWESNPLVGLWDTSSLPETPSLWTLYMGVNSVDEALEKVQNLGGTIIRPAWNSDFGRVATIQDPTGAVLNISEVDDYTPEMDEVHEPDLFAPEEFTPF